MARINALYWFVSSLSKGDRRPATTMLLICYCLSCDLSLIVPDHCCCETYRELFAELPIAIKYVLFYLLTYYYLLTNIVILILPSGGK